MRQDTAQDIAERLYRNLLPFRSGATHKYVLKPAYLDIFIGLFIKLWGKDRRFFEIHDIISRINAIPANIYRRFLFVTVAPKQDNA